jgi:hypothetical protein
VKPDRWIGLGRWSDPCSPPAKISVLRQTIVPWHWLLANKARNGKELAMTGNGSDPDPDEEIIGKSRSGSLLKSIHSTSGQAYQRTNGAIQ